MTAQDRMSRDVRSVPPDHRHLLVREGARLVGVLSNRDYRKILERAGPETVEFLARTGAPSLGKPFAMDEVRRVVRRALRGGA